MPVAKLPQVLVLIKLISCEKKIGQWAVDNSVWTVLRMPCRDGIGQCANKGCRRNFPHM